MRFWIGQTLPFSPKLGQFAADRLVRTNECPIIPIVQLEMGIVVASKWPKWTHLKAFDSADFTFWKQISSF